PARSAPSAVRPSRPTRRSSDLVPVLDVALRLGGDNRPFYIGAMGSRRTHEDRLDRLREVGLSEEHFEHFHSPIGLDLRGRTPEEDRNSTRLNSSHVSISYAVFC